MQATAGLPLLLEEGDEIALVPPATDVPRQVTVAELDMRDESRAEIAFCEVASIDVAEQMVGMHCLIRRDLIDPEVLEHAPGAWEGWSVTDEIYGRLGAVSGLVEGAVQSLLQVDRADGKGELLIPVVDEIVLSVDVASSLVRVRIPDGLLELNEKTNA